MKRTTGCLVKRGHNYYCRWKDNGKYKVKVLLDGNLAPITNKDAAIDVMETFMAPYRMKDEVEKQNALISRRDTRQADLVKKEDAANPPLIIADAWTAFERSPRKPDSGDRTLSGYESHFKRFAAWIAKSHRDVTALRDVTLAHASEYAQDLTAIGKVTPSTFNQHIGLLRLAWKVLSDEAKNGGTNPWTGITRRKIQPLANRKRPLTPEQFDSLLAAASADLDLKDLFTVLAWTGQRLVDAVKLRWETVNFRTRVITLYPQKTARRTGKAVHIPIFQVLLDVLNRRHTAMPHTTADAYVFPALVEEYDRDSGSALAKRIQDTFDRAGMETTEKRSGIKRAVVLYGAHSLRHLFVTAAASAGIPAAVIKSITGHSSDAMSEHYQQFDARLASEFSLRLAGNSTVAISATGHESREPMPGWIRERLMKMRVSNWNAIRDELLEDRQVSQNKKGANTSPPVSAPP